MDKKNIKLLITCILLVIIICMLIYILYFYKNVFERTNIELANMTERSTRIEEFYNRDMANTKIEIVNETVTQTGAKIVITDNNEYQYMWRENYTLEEKENDTWKEIKTLKDANFSEEFLKVNENNQIEQNLDWTNIYGTLHNGIYRVIKHVYTSTSDIYFESNEFEIK